MSSKLTSPIPPLSFSNSRPRIKHYRPLRLHTSAAVEDQFERSFCSKYIKPLEVKEYSNKFLREGSALNSEYGRIQKSLSKRMFRHKIEEKENQKNQGKSESYIDRGSQKMRKSSKSSKISTSRALQLFSKILKTKKTQPSVIQYRKTTFRNSNFNIQRINLQQKQQQKPHQPVPRQYIKHPAKTESKTQHILRRPQRPRKLLLNIPENTPIDPWQIYVDNDL